MSVAVLIVSFLAVQSAGHAPQSAASRCSLPKIAGECIEALPINRFYYDHNAHQCKPFEFTGCGGNANNFRSLVDCQTICGGRMKRSSDEAVAHHPSITPVTSMTNCDNVNCQNNENLVHFYADLGCKPKFSPENHCCAVSYDCSSRRQFLHSKCYLENQEYTVGEEVPYEKQPKCNAFCKCIKAENDTFLSSEHVCKTCYCRRDNNGSSNIDCEPVQCHLQFNYMNQLRRNCIPIFSKRSCCPVDFICANATTTTTNPVTPDAVAPMLNDPAMAECEFGARRFTRGETLPAGLSGDGVTCKCLLPPYFTCINDQDEAGTSLDSTTTGVKDDGKNSCALMVMIVSPTDTVEAESVVFKHLNASHTFVSTAHIRLAGIRGRLKPWPVQGVPARHVLCVMLFLGFFSAFMLRVNLSVAIVVMARHNTSAAAKDSSPAAACIIDSAAPPRLPTATNISTAHEMLENTTASEEKDMEGFILGAFFWGYLISQAPGGRIAELYGPRAVFGYSVLANAGALFPSLSAAVATWCPIDERDRFMSFAVQGATIGAVVSMPLCGTVGSALGWDAIFYVTGAIALAWSLAWFLLVSDTPQSHPRISERELQYLSKHVPPRTAQSRPVPWLGALTSTQFLVGCIAAIGTHLVPAVSLVILSMVGCNVALSVAVLTIAVTFVGAFSCGFFQNPLDVAPNFAGSLTGVMNMMGSMTGVVASPVAGLALHNHGPVGGWRTIFLIAAATYAVTSLPYLLFATSQIQPWNDDETGGDKSSAPHVEQEEAVPMNDVTKTA
ncbi:hypothetical protein B566_EDAN012142 [Ephemera danica]|nr:hypothetical protein B566_EDAN012142 [Ephemera danica]